VCPQSRATAAPGARGSKQQAHSRASATCAKASLTAAFTLASTETRSCKWRVARLSGYSRFASEGFHGEVAKSFQLLAIQGPTKTTQAPGTRLSAADTPATLDPVLHRRYRANAGELGWLNQGTRPGISHAYSELSMFVQCPGQKHMDAVEHCLKYLKDLC
jgi:hypothetical protein